MIILIYRDWFLRHAHVTWAAIIGSGASVFILVFICRLDHNFNDQSHKAPLRLHWPTIKKLFSKLAGIFCIFWSCLMSWTRWYLQFFPKLNSFPVILCWNLQNCRFSRLHFFFDWPKKLTVYQKDFKILTYSGVELCPQHYVVFKFFQDNTVFP